MKRCIVLVGGLLAGCGHSSATRFWTLDAVAPPSRPVAVAMTVPVRVDAVHVPAALDRLEVVTPTGGNRVTVHDFDRWSAPLGDSLRRALSQDLFARLPADSVVFPTAPKPPGCRSLVIDILDLQPAGTGWTIDVAWTITGTTSHRGQVRLAAAGSADPAGEAAALSALAGQLAETIAPTLAADRGLTERAAAAPSASPPPAAAGSRRRDS